MPLRLDFSEEISCSVASVLTILPAALKIPRDSVPSGCGSATTIFSGGGGGRSAVFGASALCAGGSARHIVPAMRADTMG